MLIDALTAHQMTDAEIVEMVKNEGSATVGSTGKDSENESDDDEVRVQERVPTDKCIQMTTDLIAAFEQRNILTEQEIITLYLWKDRLIKEKPQFMKQTTTDMLTRASSACKQCTVQHPVACISAATDVSPDVCQAQAPHDPPPERSATLDVTPVKTT